jgi:predicted DNA-binding transcriptional regulator YafY
MVKKSAPLLEVERLLDVVPFLSVNPYISLKELSQEFGVSEREMSNELIALSMCGLPRYTPYELIDVSIESGYVSISNHETLDMPRALTSGELTAFLLGLNLIRDSLLNRNDEERDNSDKIAHVDSLISRLKVFLDTPIEVNLGSSSHYLSEIERAIASRGVLSIRYLSSSDDVAKNRDIQPLALTKDGQQIYLSAYCLASQAHRSFRLDRIEALSPATHNHQADAVFELPSDLESKDDVEKIAPKKIKLKIKRNKRRYAELLNIDSVPASGLVEIEVYSEAWLVRAVSASAGEIEIVSGAEIAAQIVARATKILALYRS